MKILFAIVMTIFSISSWAKWHLKGSITRDGVIQEIDRRFEDGESFKYNNKHLIFIIQVESVAKDKRIKVTIKTHRIEGKSINELYAYSMNHVHFNQPVQNNDDTGSYNYVLTDVLE